MLICYCLLWIGRFYGLLIQFVALGYLDFVLFCFVSVLFYLDLWFCWVYLHFGLVLA